MKKNLIGLLGLILTPIFMVMFFVDRVFSAFLWWHQSDTLKVWIGDHQKVAYSFIRVLTIATIYSIYKIIGLWI